MPEPNRVEGLKLDFELHKHLTTLSTGILVFGVSLFDKVLPHPHYVRLFQAAIFFQILSLIGSLLAMWMTAAEVRTGLDAYDMQPKLARTSTWMSLYGFAIGLGLIGFFSLFNAVGT